MSATKKMLEDLSVELGFDGEINETVLAEAVKRAKSNEYLGWINGMVDGSPERVKIEKCGKLGHLPQEINKGRCWTYCVCNKCHIEWQVDSSD